MKKLLLNRAKIKSLATASHDLGINGRKVGENNPSEWAWAMAACQFPVGAAITLKDFKKELEAAIVYEELSKMIDDGKVLMVLDKDNNINMVGIDE